MLQRHWIGLILTNRATRIICWLLVAKVRLFASEVTWLLSSMKVNLKLASIKAKAHSLIGMVKLALDKGISKAQLCGDLDIIKTSLYLTIGKLKVQAMARR